MRSAAWFTLEGPVPVHVKPSSFPVEVSVVEVDKNGKHLKKTLFYGRFGNGTRAITVPSERESCQLQV